MPSEEHQLDVPALERSREASVERSSSRLLQRGIAALNSEETATLEVVDVVASGQSLYVFAEKWLRLDSLVELQASRWYQTQIEYYEFSSTGAFLDKRQLRLAARPLWLEATGAEVKAHRNYVYIGEFCQDHRYEHDPERCWVTVNYVFDLLGRCLSCWGAGDLVDFVPYDPAYPMLSSAFQPTVTTDRFLLHLTHSPEDAPLFGKLHYPAPRKYLEEAGNLVYQASLVTSQEFFRERSEHQSIDDRASQFQFGVPMEIAFYKSLLSYEALVPWYHARWSLERFIASSSDTAWFMYSSTGHYEELDTLWSWRLVADGPEVAVYSLPDPASLVTRGFVGTYDLYDDDDTIVGRIVGSPDGFALAGTPERCRDVWSGSRMNYNEVFVSGNTVLLSLRVDSPDANEDPLVLVLKEKSGELILERVLDISLQFGRTLAKGYEVVITPPDKVVLGAEDQKWYQDVFPELRQVDHMAFRSGLIYSRIRSTDRPDRILVTDMQTGRVSWFQPEVPISVLGTKTS